MRLPIGLAGSLRRLRDLLTALFDRARRAHVAHPGLTAAKAGIAVLLVSVALGTGAFAASSLYGQYGGARAQANALDWAARGATYSRTACIGCHRGQQGTGAVGRHAGVTCEACHMPVADHPGTGRGVVALPVPESGICVTCHGLTAGRPATFPQIDPAGHYGGAACLRCHDPHTTAAVAPPEVTHPLDRLPACTTCHAPDGLKKVPAGHEMVGDDICLSCHGARAREP